MNVKPGDLAYIMAGSAAGHVVTVVRPLVSTELFRAVCGNITSCTPRRPVWVVESSGPIPWPDVTHSVYHYKQRAVADCLLRPIRGPGEDAVDEMVALLGAPVTAHVCDREEAAR